MLGALVHVAAGPPINCTNPSQPRHLDTMVSTALQGAPVASIPVGSIPVGSILIGSLPVGSINIANTPVGSIPLGSIPVGSIVIDRVNIQYSPVGSIPVGVDSRRLDSRRLDSRRLDPGRVDRSRRFPRRLDPGRSIPVASISKIFSCNPTCPSNGNLRDHPLKTGLTFEDLLRALAGSTALDGITLADVIGYTAPGILHNYTVAQLLNSLPPNAGITYADVLALLLDPGSLRWETLDLAATPVQDFAASGGKVTYQASFGLSGSGSGPSPATVDVKLPTGFIYSAGTAKLYRDNDGSLEPRAGAAGRPTDAR